VYIGSNIVEKMQIIIRRNQKMSAAHKYIVIGRRPRFFENLLIYNTCTYITRGTIIYIHVTSIHNNVHVISFHCENFEMSVLLRECIQYNIVAFINFFCIGNFAYPNDLLNYKKPIYTLIAGQTRSQD
jgi:hypothetical protein